MKKNPNVKRFIAGCFGSLIFICLLITGICIYILSTNLKYDIQYFVNKFSFDYSPVFPDGTDRELVYKNGEMRLYIKTEAVLTDNSPYKINNFFYEYYFIEYNTDNSRALAGIVDDVQDSYISVVFIAQDVNIDCFRLYKEKDEYKDYALIKLDDYEGSVSCGSIEDDYFKSNEILGGLNMTDAFFCDETVSANREELLSYIRFEGYSKKEIDMITKVIKESSISDLNVLGRLHFSKKEIDQWVGYAYNSNLIELDATYMNDMRYPRDMKFLRWLIGHELGHIFEDSAVTEEDHVKYKQLRGIPADAEWYSNYGNDEDAWKKTPNEDFAEVFTKLYFDSGYEIGSAYSKGVSDETRDFVNSLIERSKPVSICSMKEKVSISSMELVRNFNDSVTYTVRVPGSLENYLDFKYDAADSNPNRLSLYAYSIRNDQVYLKYNFENVGESYADLDQNLQVLGPNFFYTDLEGEYGKYLGIYILDGDSYLVCNVLWDDPELTKEAILQAFYLEYK